MTTSKVTFGNVLLEYDKKDLTILILDTSDNTSSKTLAFKKVSDFYAREFLISIIDYVIDRASSGIKAVTLYNDGLLIIRSLKKLAVVNKETNNKKINLITSDILKKIFSRSDIFKASNIEKLKTLYRSKQPGLFQNDVSISSFPETKDIRGHIGKRIDSILKNYISNYELANILASFESYYLESKISLDQWAFFNLLLNTRVRIGSIRLISVSDLVHNEDQDEYYIYIRPEKQNVDNPNKSVFKLTKTVGRILRKQRLKVLQTEQAQLTPKTEQSSIALFPVSLYHPSLWQKSNVGHGYYRSVAGFRAYYQTSLNKLLPDKKINSRAFRHSIGTHLASIGCSAKTIQAALRHVSERTCQSYIEIHLGGNIEQLSNSIKPAFDKYFPVYKEYASIKDAKSHRNVISNDNLDTGENFDEGLCGADAQCLSAPFSCYSCLKFTPFYDAKHESNLKIINSKIEKFENQGIAFSGAIQTLKLTKSFIELTIQSCDLYKRTLENED